MKQIRAVAILPIQLLFTKKAEKSAQVAPQILKNAAEQYRAFLVATNKK